MIEPHSAQLGASSWILNATLVLPSESVTVEPLPFEALAGAACPFVAMTASSSLAGDAPTLGAPTLGVSAATAGEPAPTVVAPSFKAGVVSTATDARGS